MSSPTFHFTPQNITGERKASFVKVCVRNKRGDQIIYIINITIPCLIVLRSVSMTADLFWGILDSFILLRMAEHSDQWGGVHSALGYSSFLSVSLFSPPVSYHFIK